MLFILLVFFMRSRLKNCTAICHLSSCGIFLYICLVTRFRCFHLKNYTLSTHVVHSFRANKSLNYAIITPIASQVLLFFFRSQFGGFCRNSLTVVRHFAFVSRSIRVGFWFVPTTVNLMLVNLMFLYITHRVISPFHSRQKVHKRINIKINSIFASV